VSRDKAEGLQERLELFRDELEKKTGELVVFEVEAIPIDILRFRAAPDGEKDQGASSRPRIDE
jgi:hypothetical protein